MKLSDRKNSKGFSNFRFEKTLFNLLLILFLQICAADVVSAQENIVKDIVPPPLSIISKGEAEQLNAQNDLKKRTELALGFMENRLLKAEKLSNEKNYKESLDELGGFQAIMQNAVSTIKRSPAGRGKVISNFKRLEITLRSFIPRLELIRRTMPERYAYHVLQLLKAVRKARTDAVEPLFDNSVVTDG